jgi:hypothetical protein
MYHHMQCLLNTFSSTGKQKYIHLCAIVTAKGVQLLALAKHFYNSFSDIIDTICRHEVHSKSLQ